MFASVEFYICWRRHDATVYANELHDGHPNAVSGIDSSAEDDVIFSYPVAYLPRGSCVTQRAEILHHLLCRQRLRLITAERVDLP